MRLPLRQADQIHPVRGGYYYKTANNMLYFFPAKPGKNYGPGTGSKQLLMINCPASDWEAIRKEK